MNRNLKYALVAVVFTGGAVLVAAAQTPPPAAAPVAPVTPSAAPTPAPTPAVSPERFEPTDKVRADFDVSFPIDI